jgi:membrane-associated PAP2 superfamily phosphatase
MTESRSAFLFRNLGPMLPLAIFLLALETTRFDALVSGWFYDAASGGFPLRYNSFLEVVAHQWAKGLVVVIVCAIIAMLLISYVTRELASQRGLLLFLALSLTLAPLTVALLKTASARHCPWSLLEYGGFAPHLTLFEFAPAGLAPGHCFPAGHASTGFCLLAFHFAGRALGIDILARLGLAVGIAAGIALGLGRIAQGAHFASHVLWSGLVSWSVIAILFSVTLLRHERPALASPA